MQRDKNRRLAKEVVELKEKLAAAEKEPSSAHSNVRLICFFPPWTIFYSSNS